MQQDSHLGRTLLSAAFDSATRCDKLPRRALAARRERRTHGARRRRRRARDPRRCKCHRCRSLEGRWQGGQCSRETSVEILGCEFPLELNETAYWFKADHKLKTGRPFRYHESQQEAIETLIYVWEIEKIRTRTPWR